MSKKRLTKRQKAERDLLVSIQQHTTDFIVKAAKVASTTPKKKRTAGEQFMIILAEGLKS